MHLSRVVVATAVLALGAADAGPRLRAQARANRAPDLTRQQRTTLEALVSAVDAALAGASSEEATWSHHVLRASDGSHYLAVNARLASAAPPSAASGVYVRLATRRPAGAAVLTERSAVMEWLKGQRGEPLPLRPARATTVNPGEMPVGGTAAAVGDVTAEASTALRLLSLQQEREARQREAREAQRRAELESASVERRSSTYPFEDFDLTGRSITITGGRVEVRRGVTTGPGDYDLLLAVALPGPAGAIGVQVARTRIVLPAAGSDFAMSDVIVASDVAPLAVPHSPADQSAHPYAIGPLDVTPAPGNTLAADQSLALIYQVINPSGSARGKPDVEVAFQVSRVIGDRTEPFGMLQSQRHDERTVPGDFDTAQRHPLFGAIRASLASFARGRYRVTVTAHDRLSDRRAMTTAEFEVRGTAASLLREAPALGRAFRREAILDPPLVAAMTRALSPPAPSPALAEALAAASGGRFTFLLRDLTVAPGEQALALGLRALGLYAVGDSPRAVMAQTQQALAKGAPPAALLVVLGATSALAGDHKAAVAQWHQARDAGLADALVAPLLIDAYLRLGDGPRASAMASAALDATPTAAAAIRMVAATHLASGRYAEALSVLDAHSGDAADEVAFLRLHALYALLVQLPSNDASAEHRRRFVALARPYLAATGPHHELVAAWLGVAEAIPGR